MLNAGVVSQQAWLTMPFMRNASCRLVRVTAKRQRSPLTFFATAAAEAAPLHHLRMAPYPRSFVFGTGRQLQPGLQAQRFSRLVVLLRAAAPPAPGELLPADGGSFYESSVVFTNTEDPAATVVRLCGRNDTALLAQVTQVGNVGCRFVLVAGSC